MQITCSQRLLEVHSFLLCVAFPGLQCSLLYLFVGRSLQYMKSIFIWVEVSWLTRWWNIPFHPLVAFTVSSGSVLSCTVKPCSVSYAASDFSINLYTLEFILLILSVVTSINIHWNPYMFMPYHCLHHIRGGVWWALEHEPVFFFFSKHAAFIFFRIRRAFWRVSSVLCVQWFACCNNLCTYIHEAVFCL